jgi:3-hydroxyacyl-CoA dehydrogenase
MVERGEATPEDVDTAMKLGAGYRELSLPLTLFGANTS